MKLVERELGLEIELKENIVPVVILEDITFRLSTIEELRLQLMGREGNWLLVENEKNYELAKNVELILEPFSLQLNNKKVKMKLFQEIKTLADDFFYLESLEVHAHISNYIENLIERLSYPIRYKEEWNLLEILKVYNVELEEECDSVCEKLFHYIKIVNQVCGTRIIITVNLKKYLSEIQLLELYKIARYSKIQLVLIEFDMSGGRHECEEIYIVD